MLGANLTETDAWWGGKSSERAQGLMVGGIQPQSLQCCGDKLVWSEKKKKIQIHSHIKQSGH